jgi:hypothetical protein
MLARTENIARIGSWEWDVATDTVIWSDELFRIFQRDPVGGAPSFAQYTELYHPDDAVRWREAVESAVVRGTPYELELRLLRQDGTVRHCLNRGYPEKGVDGKVVRLYGSLQDITEFKLAQERIEHLNNVLRSIRDINQLIIHERDRDTLIREGCRLLVDNRGYTGSLIVLTDENDRPVSWTGAGMEASSGPLNAMLERGELPPCCELTRSVKEVLLIKDQDSVCSRCPNAALHTGADTMCVRLINDDDAFGYLAVVTERSLEVDSEERSLFAEMAGDLAYALRVFSNG